MQIIYQKLLAEQFNLLTQKGSGLGIHKIANKWFTLSVASIFTSLLLIIPSLFHIPNDISSASSVDCNLYFQERTKFLPSCIEILLLDCEMNCMLPKKKKRKKACMKQFFLYSLTVWKRKIYKLMNGNINIDISKDSLKLKMNLSCDQFLWFLRNLFFSGLEKSQNKILHLIEPCSIYIRRYTWILKGWKEWREYW